MKIRMDFVTNSSSSSFVLVMRFTLRSGEVIKYSTTGSYYPETDDGEHNMMEVSCDPESLGKSATVKEMIEELEDGVRDRDPHEGDEGAPSRRVLSSGSKLIRQLSKIPSMDDISKITINADTYVGNGGENEHKYQHYTYDRDCGLTVGDEGNLNLYGEGDGGELFEVSFDLRGRNFGKNYLEGNYTEEGGYDQDVEPDPAEMNWNRTAPRDRSVYRFEDYYTDMCLVTLGFKEMSDCIERYALAGASAKNRDNYSQFASRLKRGYKQGENRLQIRGKRFCSSYTGEFRTRMGELIARCGGVLEDELSDETDTFILSLLPGTRASELEAARAWQKRHPRRSVISDYTLWELLLDEGLQPGAEEIAWCAARGLNLENALREEPLSEEELAQERARQTALARYQERMKKACEAHVPLGKLILRKDKRKPFCETSMLNVFERKAPVQIYGRSFCLDAYPDAAWQYLSEEIGARGGRVVQKSRKYDYLVIPVIPWRPDEYPESDEEAENFRANRQYGRDSHADTIKWNCESWDNEAGNLCRNALEMRAAGRSLVQIISDYQLFVAFESQPRYTEEELDRMSSEEALDATKRQGDQKQAAQAEREAEKQARQRVRTAQQEEKQKLQAMKDALLQAEKDYSKGAVMDTAEKMHVEVIPTGCLSLDFALGVGGLPRSHIIEIYGPESSGKTTLALHTVAQTQKMGGTAAFIDAEHALDPVYAKALGVNNDELYISQPDSGEMALDICEALVRSGAIDIVVIDSVAALAPGQETMMSQALRKLTGVISKTNAVVIFINQLREKVGVMYGNPEVTTGGKALKFYASVRIEVRKGEPIKEGGNVLGNRTKIKIVKNKVAPPFRICMVDIFYGEGVSRESSLIDLAIECNLIQKSGSWFSYNGERIGQGRDNVRLFLKSHPALCDEIEQKIREEFNAGRLNVELEEGAEGEDDMDGEMPEDEI